MRSALDSLGLPFRYHSGTMGGKGDMRRSVRCCTSCRISVDIELCIGCIAPPTFQEHPEGISNYYGKIDIAKGVFGVVGEDGRGCGARV